MRCSWGMVALVSATMVVTAADEYTLTNGSVSTANDKRVSIEMVEKDVTAIKLVGSDARPASLSAQRLLGSPRDPDAVACDDEQQYVHVAHGAPCQ